MQNQRRLCTLCGLEIAFGEEYWLCNGACICSGCLVEFSKAQLLPYHEIRGKEEAQ